MRSRRRQKDKSREAVSRLQKCGTELATGQVLGANLFHTLSGSNCCHYRSLFQWLSITFLTLTHFPHFCTFSPCDAYRIAVLDVKIPFICRSVHHARAFWQNERTYCRYYDTVRSVFWPIVVHGVPRHLNFWPRMTYPFKNTDFDVFLLTFPQP